MEIPILSLEDVRKSLADDKLKEDILKKRWLLCRMDEDDIEDIQENPLAFSDGEVITIKAILGAGVAMLEKDLEDVPPFHKKMAVAGRLVLERLQKVIDILLNGVDNGCEGIPTTEGTNQSTGKKGEQITRGTGPDTTSVEGGLQL